MQRWRRQVGIGVALVAAGIGAALLDLRDVEEPARSAANSRGEDVVLWAFLCATGLAMAAARRFTPSPPRDGTSEPRWVRAVPLALFALWFGAGWLALVRADPTWAASGVDWHDSYLGAYAFAYDDPVFYAANRFPLYPRLAAGVHAAADLPLDVAMQVVTRVAMLTLPIPLWIAGRRLFGRVAAIVGSAGLLALPTFHHHADAATCYPLLAACTAWAVAGLALAAEGRAAASLVGSALFGIAVGAALATEVKAIFLGLALVPVGIAIALLAPDPYRWRWSLPLRLARVVAIALPLAASYRWMGALPVEPQSLETLTATTMSGPHANAGGAPSGPDTGYVWGRFHGSDQVFRTLAPYVERLRDPAHADEGAHRREDALRRLRTTYAGSTPRLLWAALAALVLAPIVAPRGERFRRAAIALALLAAASTAIPVLFTDYQDRYLTHVAILVPLAVAGAADLAVRGLVRLSDLAPTSGALARSAALFVGSGLALGWPGFPLAAANVAARAGAVSIGGGAEQAVRDWGDATLQPGDVLLDTTWLMNGLLLAGTHAVAREEPAYPPAGAPTAARLRVTRPGAGSGRIYALIPEDNTLLPSSGHRFTRATIAKDPSWARVAWIQPAMCSVYRYEREGEPPGWPG